MTCKQSGVLVVLVGFLLCPVGLAVEEATLREWLDEGNSYFHQANERVAQDPKAAQELYRKAILRYERIVTEGDIANGKLYYNIGNAYFRMKDLGRAILNYRRAQEYIPNDANLHQNLDYARSRRADAIEEQQKTRVLKTVFFWHYDVPMRIRSTLFMVAFLLFWCGLLLRLFVRRPALTRWLVAFLLVWVLLGGSVAAEALHDHWVRPGVILDEAVVGRKGDGTVYEPSFRDPLHAGTEFVLVENRGDWYHIELMDGRRCWIPSGTAELVR